MTTTNMRDTIEQSVFIEGAQERVWQFLTSKEGLKTWFADMGVEGDVSANSEFLLCFKFQSTGEVGKCLAKVEAFEPHSYFAYRWMPGDCSVAPVDTVPTTLVEFRLSPENGGTRLDLKESGFASLPDAMREEALKSNTGGWDEILAPFVEKFTTWNSH